MSSNTLAVMMGEGVRQTRQPVFRQLATATFPAGVASATRALHLAAGDFQVNIQPLVMRDYPTQNIGKVAVIRNKPQVSDPLVLGFGGNSLTPLQNKTLAEILDPVATKYPVSEVGILEEGKHTFFIHYYGSIEIGDCGIDEYFMVLDHKTGGKALKMVYLPVHQRSRSVLLTGWIQGRQNVSIPHIGTVVDDTRAHAVLIDQLAAMRTNVQIALRELTIVDPMDHMDEDYRDSVAKYARDEIFKAAHPVPLLSPRNQALNEMAISIYDQLDEATRMSLVRAKDSQERAEGKAEMARGFCEELYQRIVEDEPSLKRTLLAAYIAVCEYADFRVGGLKHNHSALFGKRASEKIRAFRTATELA